MKTYKQSRSSFFSQNKIHRFIIAMFSFTIFVNFTSYSQIKSYDLWDNTNKNSNFLNQNIFDDEEFEDDSTDFDAIFDFNSDNDLLPGSKKLNSFMEHPFIEIQYGIANYDYKVSNIPLFNNNFSAAGNFKLKIGDLNLKQVKKIEADNILKYSNSYLSLSHLNTEVGVTNNEDKIRVNLWKFTFFADDEGYAYKIGENSYFALYRGSEVNWNYMSLDEVNKLTPSDTNSASQEALRNFGEAARFGTSFEAGLKANIVGGIGLSASYERSMIFPRTLVFKYVASSIVHEIALGLSDSFIKKVLKASPDAAPIVNFVIKNAISYGFYELSSKSMNWPFNTAEPLMIDSFKMGLSFDF